MWFEILPSALMVIGGVWFPTACAYVMNYLVNGNGYKRSLDTFEERLGYLRDIRLDEKGNPYKVHGLERIPEEGDEEECCNGNFEEDDDI